ncbi:hypothetical protein PENTCL1PPCAC_17285, partial [Pristionchus entomophagus]
LALLLICSLTEAKGRKGWGSHSHGSRERGRGGGRGWGRPAPRPVYHSHRGFGGRPNFGGGGFGGLFGK